EMPSITNNNIPDGRNFLITRSSSGEFKMYYSTGFTYATQPTSYAGSVTDNTYSNSNFFGVYGRFVIAATSRRVYFDNIRLGDLVLTGSEGWRMLSSPVSTSFSSLLNGLFTQGISGATSTSGNPSVFV